MKSHVLLLLFSMILIYPCLADGVKDADLLAVKYCTKDYTYMGSYGHKDSRIVNKKMYLERMLELNDGKLNAYFAKDLIKSDISMYEHFLETKKAWRNSELTANQAKDFTARLKVLKQDLQKIEKAYPADYGVFERATATEVKSQK